MYKNVMTLEGNTNDLLTYEPSRNLKMTRLVDTDEYVDETEGETVDVAITSVSESGEHKWFSKIYGKKIRVTVEVEDEG